MVRVRLLGELGLEVDGADVPPPSGRPARALLGWLALHPGVHPRGLVASRLWPDVLDASARTSLRTALTRVTRAIGPAAADVLVATRATVGLVGPPGVFVDVAELAALADRGALEEAWAGARGELLRGYDDDWVLAERDVHAARVADVLERLAMGCEDRGDGQGAIAWTRRLVELHPLSEESGRRLMRRLADAGDQGTALVAFGRLRDRLAAELAVGVSAETRALAAELRGQVPAQAAVPLPPLVAARRSSGFVGRTRDLALLRTVWDAALEGDRAVAALAGHPGVGKTSLVAEFARRLHADGAQVLFGRCDQDAPLSYQPFIEALGQLVAGLPPERLAAWSTLGAGELTRVLPLLAARSPDLPAPVEGDPGGARHRLFAAIAAVLDYSASATPTLLVIDDLHWADGPTLHLLSHLGRVPRNSRLLILATLRRAELASDDDLAHALDNLQRDRLLRRITLDGMPEREIEALVTGLSGHRPSAALVSALRNHTDGNPFFVEELLRHWSNELPEGEEREVARALHERGLPAGVTDIISRRLALLPAEALRVLRLASVLGREFDFAVLAGLADMDDEQLLSALADPVRARIVAEIPGGAAGRFAFHHALVRDVLYQSIPETERALLHRRVGTALERPDAGAAAPSLAELVHHFALAPRGGARRAAVYAERAAEQALAELAYEQAVAHFTRALALRPDAERAGRAELLLRLGEAQTRAGELQGARAAFSDAIVLSRELGESSLFALAALGFAGRRVEQVSRREEPEIGLLEEALDLLGEGDRALRARILARLAQAHYAADKHARVERLAAAARAEARAATDDGALMAALEAGLFARWVPGGAAERRRDSSELIAVAERAGARDRIAEGLNWRLVAALELGDLRAADADIAGYAELAAELRVPQLLNYAGVHRALRALFDGRFDDAEALASAALAVVADGADDAAQLFGIQLFTLRDEQGRLAELEPVLAAYAASDDAAPTWRLALAWARAETGRLDEARADLALLAAGGFAALPRDVTWPSSMSLAARLSAALEDQVAGEVAHRQLLSFADLHVISAHALYGGPVTHHLGLAATAAGRLGQAIEHFDAALRAEERMGCRPWGAHTRAACAAALRRRDAPGDAARAASLADGARKVAEDLSMTRLSERLRAFAA